MSGISTLIKGKVVVVGINVNYQDIVSKAIVQIDSAGNVIAEYDSIYAAQKITGIKHIYECVNHKRKTAGGYYWLEKGEYSNGFS